MLYAQRPSQFYASVLPSKVPGDFGVEEISLEHITAIEAAAVNVLLETFPEIRDGLWLHFIDNATLRSAL